MTDLPRSVGTRAAARTTQVAAESATRTEVLARAYLQALQTRREIDGAGGDGFEALVLQGVAGIVDELTGLFEQSLRGEQPDGQRDGEWLQQRFIVLDWFRNAVTGYAPMTALSANLEELAGTAATLFEGGEEQLAA